MHLQQTKRASIETGGPQYYFHDLSDAVKTYLRAKGAVRVALITPYGATKTDYFAVSTDRKLNTQLKPVPGNVGHDRIQQGRAAQSIGEAIRFWYRPSDSRSAPCRDRCWKSLPIRPLRKNFAAEPLPPIQSYVE